jgi:3-methylcrotonyl-CoA carboxylase alpha subunit
MFQTVLIANRGEIACRIIATCRRLGVASVAVYSQADVNARHVRLADRALYIGAAPARDSYLRADRIIEGREAQRGRGDSPGLRLSGGEPGLRRAVRRGRPGIHRPNARGDARDEL